MTRQLKSTCFFTSLIPLTLSLASINILYASESEQAVVGELWPLHSHPATIERTLTAFTEPAAHLQLAAEFPARVKSILVKEGQTVPHAQSGWASAVQLDRGLLEFQINEIEQLVLSNQALVAQSEAELTRANDALAFQKLEAERIRKLADAQQVSQQQFDTALHAVQQHQQFVAIAQQSLLQAQAQNAVLQSQITSLDERIARHTLQAPSGWLLRQVLLEPGSMVQAGQAILELSNINELAVHLSLSQDEIAAIHTVNSLPITIIDGHQQKALTATIHRRDVVADPVTRKRLIELRLDASQLSNPSGGLEVSVNLSLVNRDGGYRIPQDALIQRLEQFFIMDSSGKEWPIEVMRMVNQGLIINAENLPEDIQVQRRPFPSPSTQNDEQNQDQKQNEEIEGLNP